MLPFGRLWYDTPGNAIGYAMRSSRSHNAVIRVYEPAGNVIETQEHWDDFKEARRKYTLSYLAHDLVIREV